MKKFLATLLTALMLCLMIVPAFASSQREADEGNVKFGIQKQLVPQKLDGVIDEYEYYEVALKSSWLSIAVKDDANDPKALNLNPKMYLSWDDQYVYFASIVKPAQYEQTFGGDPPSMWQSNAIQMNFSAVDKEGEDRLEYGIGRTSDAGELLSTVWADYLGAGFTPSKDNFIVTYANGTLTYECKTPWTAFMSGCPGEGGQFGLCVVWATGVGDDYIHTQLAAGCTGYGKHADYFAKVTLEKAPEMPVDEVVVEDAAAPAVAAPTAPVVAAQTSDALVVFVVIAMISLAGTIIFKKVRA